MSTGSSEKSGHEPKRDIAALARIIQLPVQPVEVWFDSIPRGKSGGMGPTDHTFVAVMRFEAKALETFLNSNKLTEKTEARFPSHEVAPWFPPAVMAALEPLDADYKRVKGRRFEATPFAKGPGVPGSFFVLHDAPFVILRRPEP